MPNTKTTRGRKRGQARRKPVRRAQPTSNSLVRFADMCRNLTRLILGAFARFIAVLRAMALIAVAIYKLWRLLNLLERASPRGKDRFMDDLKENLRELRITMNVDDLDVAIAYTAAVPRVIGNSSCSSKAAIAWAADDLLDTLIAIFDNALYAKGVTSK